MKNKTAIIFEFDTGNLDQSRELANLFLKWATLIRNQCDFEEYVEEKHIDWQINGCLKIIDNIFPKRVGGYTLAVDEKSAILNRECYWAE